jgi:sulfoxide reductase heme-binding subunit YedZ
MKKYYKPSIFFLSLIPFVLIFYKIIFNKLGPEPVKEITHFTGEWTLLFIIFTLSMSPLKKITKLNIWISLDVCLVYLFFFMQHCIC